MFLHWRALRAQRNLEAQQQLKGKVPQLDPRIAAQIRSDQAFSGRRRGSEQN